jgi:hypothetical protein
MIVNCGLEEKCLPVITLRHASFVRIGSPAVTLAPMAELR